MAALSIQVPYPVFYDRDGQPLDNGNIYIGVANLDPVTNPLTVYYDEALTITASQPLVTSGGYVYRNGTPTQLYVNATDFSITVNDSKNLFVYSFPEATGIGVNAAAIEYDPPFTGAVTSGYTVQDKLSQTVSVLDFGAVGNGVADDTAAFEAALAASGCVYVPEGTYLVSRAIRLTGNKRLFGDGKTLSILKRTSTTPETINGASVVSVLYTSSRYNSVENIGLTGDRTGVATTASVDGIYFGDLTELTNNSSFINIRVFNANRALNCAEGAFMTIFDQVSCHLCISAFDFSSSMAKTSLTFNSCWSENCGQAWDFQFTIYSVMNACGADYANYTSSGNPYGVGFGSRSTIKGVYNFITSNMTLNSCGAEYSYGDGVFKFNGACQIALNAPNQFGCSSEYVPNYASYGDVAVGPIQTEVAGPVNLLQISSPRDMSGWTNPVVATTYPTKPISALLAFNYLDGTYGVRTDTPAVITSASGLSSDLIKGVASDKYAVAINQLKRDPVIIGTLTQGGVQSRSVSVTGTGTIISIPFVSQGGRNFSHLLRIMGRRNQFNSNVCNGFAATIGVSSLLSLANVTSGNLFNVTSVTISGLNLLITLGSSIVDPIMFVEAQSENIALIDFANATIS